MIFIQVHFKGRLLDKLLRKQNTSQTVAKRNYEFQIKTEQLLLEKKQRNEENEARRKTRVEEKDLKMRQLALEAGRKNEIRLRIRDMEKVRSLRNCLHCVHLIRSAIANSSATHQPSLTQSRSVTSLSVPHSLSLSLILSTPLSSPLSDSQDL